MKNWFPILAAIKNLLNSSVVGFLLISPPFCGGKG
nr:MAG TPA: restriction alleviation protein [Caudoviricetes sp.]